MNKSPVTLIYLFLLTLCLYTYGRICLLSGLNHKFEFGLNYLSIVLIVSTIVGSLTFIQLCRSAKAKGAVNNKYLYYLIYGGLPFIVGTWFYASMCVVPISLAIIGAFITGDDLVSGIFISACFVIFSAAVGLMFSTFLGLVGACLLGVPLFFVYSKLTGYKL